MTIIMNKNFFETETIVGTYKNMTFSIGESESKTGLVFEVIHDRGLGSSSETTANGKKITITPALPSD